MNPNPENHKRRIFLVEDEPMVASLLKEMLDEEFEVEVFSLAEHALREGLMNPDLVITDYRMPGMNGLELIREVRKRWPNAKAILISGNILEGENWPAGLKPDAFVAKPFRPSQIVEVARRVLLE